MPYPGITFRPIGADDLSFLYQVYASTRLDEIAPLNWPQEQIDHFLQMQFNAQHTHYQHHYGHADFDLILLDEQAIGRLYIERTEDAIHIIDIALIPEYRNRGIGGVLLADLLDEATTSCKRVQIYVEKFNPALRLYQRLGFRELEDNGVYYYMEWSPTA
ncbi:MAG: GNAT family N-acetyltransferase [Candidatus Tectomicrobia bacterium]|nr:GNAT family N-acetyltransferase [Candidatus Tectomicrobia bacterium]